MVFFSSSSSYLGFWKTSGMPLFPSNKSQEKTIRGSMSFGDFKNSQDFWGYSQILRHTPTQWVARCYRVLLLWMMLPLVQVGGGVFLFGTWFARWWFFQRSFIFTRGGNAPIWWAIIFQMGWFNHQLVRVGVSIPERFEPRGSTIIHIKAREIFDSRGNPTVEVGDRW